MQLNIPDVPEESDTCSRFGGELALFVRDATESRQFRVDKDLSVQTLKSSKALLAPLPNLFRSVFEQAQRQSPGEQWLKQQLVSFDGGGRRRRKQVLEEFLEYVSQSSASSIQGLFSTTAHLFFVRLTSWFSVTMPLLYELPLQLKVFLVFLQFREKAFVEAFFESGTVITLLQSLSLDYDVSDDARCLTLLVLEKLASNGRKHKEALCAKDLIDRLVDCVCDSLKWETLKCAGRLFCETFHGNPTYQKDVIVALQKLIKPQQRSLTQRIGIQALIGLFASDLMQLPALLSDTDWHREVVPQIQLLLDGQDIRVAADAYCLINRVLQSFNCDHLLFDFARKQLQSQLKDAEAWANLEIEALEVSKKASTTQVPMKAKGANGQKSSFREDATYSLKLSVMVLLSKRNQIFCMELVEAGLTETLLLYVLDVAHPMRQSAALGELHRLTLCSRKARQIAVDVLVKQDFLRAVTLKQFMAAGSPDDFARARFRLRGIWGTLPMHEERRDGRPTLKHRHTAIELDIQQRLMEHTCKDLLVPKETQDQVSLTSAFLTEGPAEHHGDGPDQRDDVVHRSGSKTFAMKRVPARDQADLAEGDISAHRYSLVRGPIEDEYRGLEEPPILSALFSLVADPLDVAMEGGSSLLEDLRGLERIAGFGQSSKTRQTSALTVQPKQGSPKRASHRSISVSHQRALALRPITTKRQGASSVTTAMKEYHEEHSDAASEVSDISLRCVFGVSDLVNAVSDDWGKRDSLKVPTMLHQGCGGCHNHSSSLADTTVGNDVSQEMSQEDSYQFMSRDSDALWHNAQEDSLAGLSIDFHMSRSHTQEDCTPSHQRHRIRVLDKSALAAVVEVPPIALGEESDVATNKKVLCVATAPYHRCVAFNGGHDDALFVPQSRREAAQMLQPSTRELFKNIQDAGKFQRRWLTGSGNRQLAPKLAPISKPGSQTARERRAVDGSRIHVEVIDSITESAKPGGIINWRPLTEAELTAYPVPSSFRDFFPASARQAS